MNIKKKKNNKQAKAIFKTCKEKHSFYKIRKSIRKMVRLGIVRV